MYGVVCLHASLDALRRVGAVPAILVLVCAAIVPYVAGGGSSVEEGCLQCRFLVETFQAGMQKTAKLHFAGGNTDWEERNLGRFATSETRFVEVLEYACKKEALDNSKDFDLAKDLKFKCHGILEEHEETLENWFFKKQDTESDLYKYICIDELRRCCPSGHFGVACEPCPAAKKGLPACFGRGTCDGDGYRGGNGKCKCERGYVGSMCSNCDAHFFPLQQNDSFIECSECFDGCASGCTAAGPKGCRSCRTGYIWDAELGCKDINECLEMTKCTKEHEVCINTEGSFRCECGDGYRRDKMQDCVVDVEAKEPQSWIASDQFLRICSYVGLLGISIFSLSYNPSYTVIVLLVIAVLAMLYIEFLVPEDLINSVQNDFS